PVVAVRERWGGRAVACAGFLGGGANASPGKSRATGGPPASPGARDAAGGFRRAAPPRRIISLVPATTEMIFAMGAGDRLVGVGSYDNYPPEVTRLPRLGGLIDPNVERGLALKPDLAIVYDTQAGFKQQLERAGIPIFGYVHRGLADVTATIRSLGARIGFDPQARALADGIERRLDAVRSRVAGRPRPKTLLVFGREPGALRGIDASG